MWLQRQEGPVLVTDVFLRSVAFLVKKKIGKKLCVHKFICCQTEMY